MLSSINDVQETLNATKYNALAKSTKKVKVSGRNIEIPQPFPSPEDWRDGWIYFILVDRFNNPDAPPKSKWDEAVGTFQGGNLQGIKAQLPYLQELGAKAIWLSPILKNRISDDFSYHGYGIQDFLSVDPRFGTEQDIISLVDEAHARGIYVILDIVLNHVGDVFAYKYFGSEASWNDREYVVNWRDENGNPNPNWEVAAKDAPPDAEVMPSDLRKNEYFRRKGMMPNFAAEVHGDFLSLRELVTEKVEDTPDRGRYYPVRDALIRVYQYWIAKADIDGFRIDTLKYIEPGFARIFGNAMREFAQSIGKKNFFTFGEVYDSEEQIARFVGREAAGTDELIGVDAALDFPLFFKLPYALKGNLPPAEVANMFEHRKNVEKRILSSHGEAGRYFVTFLDNHDQRNRFYFLADSGKFDAQLPMAVACLFSLQGIPCLYYGTEQGLHGIGGSDQNVREALWGKPNSFDRKHSFYSGIKYLSKLREQYPALRYGRQYFRPISGNGTDFGISPFNNGVLAFSRILNDTETVIALNTSTTSSFSGEVLVDIALNPFAANYNVVYSNMVGSQAPVQVKEKAAGTVVFHNNGSADRSAGPVRTLPINLNPMEIKVLSREIPAELR